MSNENKRSRPMRGGGPMGPGPGMGATEKAKDFKGSIGNLAKYMAEFNFKIERKVVGWQTTEIEVTA